MSIKRLVSAKSRDLLENTTRSGGDFQARPKGPGLAFGKGHGVTFAPEIKQKHGGALIKSNREAIGIGVIKGSQEEKQSAGGEFQKNYLLM